MTDLIRPVAGRITQDFDGAFAAERPGYLRTNVNPHRGNRTPIGGGSFRRDLHLAIDYAVPTGTGVRAMATGPIVRQGVDYSSGGAVFVNQRVHRGPNFDLFMLYYHLRANGLKFPVGKIVPQGTVLALSGNTGWSSGPHLHIELVRLTRGASPDSWYSGLRLDPQPFINGTAHFADLD